MTLPPSNTTIAVITTAAAAPIVEDECASPEADCVPEGFWALAATSIAVMVAMIIALVWISSPRCFCQCCGNMRRGVAEIRSGLHQFLIETRGGNTSEPEEPSWVSQPQTTREIEMVEMQARKRREAEEADKTE